MIYRCAFWLSTAKPDKMEQHLASAVFRITLETISEDLKWLVLLVPKARELFGKKVYLCQPNTRAGSADEICWWTCRIKDCWKASFNAGFRRYIRRSILLDFAFSFGRFQLDLYQSDPNQVCLCHTFSKFLETMGWATGWNFRCPMYDQWCKALRGMVAAMCIFSTLVWWLWLRAVRHGLWGFTTSGDETRPQKRECRMAHSNPYRPWELHVNSYLFMKQPIKWHTRSLASLVLWPRAADGFCELVIALPLLQVASSKSGPRP